MSKIRMDFARNEISDLSFICLDPIFFSDDYNSAKAETNKNKTETNEAAEEETKEVDAAVPVDYSKLGSALASNIANDIKNPFKKLNKAPRETVTKDDFGFMSDSDEEDENEEDEDEVADQIG